MVNSQGKWMIVAAFLFFAMLFSAGLKGYNELSDKANAQDQVNESIQQWRQSYKALSSSMTRWDKDFPGQAAIPDLATLFSSLRLSEYGLITDLDQIQLTKTEVVRQDEVDIGLTKVCMATAGDSGLVVQAGDYGALFDAIRRLAKRPELMLGAMSIQGEKPTPSVRLIDFCMLLRR